jgi:RES domain-containing protein
VHLDVPLELLPDDYVLLRVRLPEMAPDMVAEVPIEPQSAGDAWLRAGAAATLRVPSVLVPFAFNMLLNPRHPRAAEAAVVDTTPFRFDARLWEGPT